MHELSDMVERGANRQEDELRLRIRQLEAGETRTLSIVRALTCFYTAVAGFVASTLVSLSGAVLVSMRIERGVSFSFAVAFLAGAVGVFAMITGAVMLARETTFSFRVLREEKTFIAGRVHDRVAKLTETAPAKRA
jgi:hypothetical protein